MSDTITVADPIREVVHLTTAVAASRALHVVAELGVADTVGPDEEIAVVKMAERCGCHPDALHRVLRLLEIHGVFRSERDCWSHTPTSVLLRSDHPTSMRAYARMIGQPVSWEPMTQLAASLRNGRPAPILEAAGGLFPYLAQHPEQLTVFDEAMTAKSHADVAGIVAAVDFSAYATIADIGGGRGHLLRAIVQRHREVKGILFDLPQVVKHYEPDDTGRVACHSGDFFVDHLPVADLSILMQVIHDWDDDDAQRILVAVAAAAEAGSTLMLFELVLPEQPTDDTANVIDVFMLAVTGGRERTAAEYTTLLDRAGFDTVAIRHVVGSMFVIEARRR